MTAASTAPPPRRLAAIFFADLSGYGSLMSANEDETVRVLKEHQAVVLPLIASYGGRAIDLAGDGILAVFQSVLAAVEAAITMQSVMAKRNTDEPANRRMRFRIGINQGDIIYDETRVYGDGINVAARMQALAEPGGICISGKVYDEVRDRIPVTFRDLGERKLKNISRMIRVYAIGEAATETPYSQKPANTAVMPSMVVLPFQNLSGDPEQEYFADGVVEDLTTALSKFKSFAVVSRNSAFVYKGRAVDVRQIARELGVRYVLEGSVRRSGERLRFTAQLIDGVSGAHLWADHLDGTIDDVFDFQDRLTESVVSIIEPQIRVAEIERSRRERPESIAAYDLYLRALAKIYTFHEQDNASACALLDEALRLEPDNGVFLGTAAWALEHRNSMGWPPIGPDDHERCMELARRGLVQANGDASVMAHCGLALLHGREYDIAFGTVERAVQINPNSLVTLVCAAIGHLHVGSIDQALTYLHRALKLSPGDPSQGWALTAIAHAEIVRGNYAEAARWAERSLSVDGHFGPTHWMLIAANAHLGRIDDARRFLSRYRRIAPGVTIASIRAGQPALNPDRIEPILQGLRLAGLEEVESADA